MTMRLFRGLVVGALLASTVVSLGKWATPTQMPVDRVVKNAEDLLAKDPKDAKAHYVLARALSYRFAFPDKTVEVYQSKGEVHFPYYDAGRYSSPKDKNGKSIDDLLGSLTHYKNAKDLDPSDTLARIGFAWMCEQAADYGEKLPELPGIAPAGQSWRAWFLRALFEYRAIYGSEKAGALKSDELNFSISEPAMEAVDRITVIITKKMVGSFKDGEWADFKAFLKAMDEKPKLITPIIVPLGAENPGSLVDMTSKVRFDLSGSGLVRESGWVTPSAGLLCWDPDGSGKITSGTQLFGTGTFWMFFGNGFDAMGYLDDNHDGWLSGHELDGICLWHDADGDGVSNQREVRPVTEWGIKALKWRGYREGSLGYENAGAVVWTDGHVTSLYDWVTQEQ